MNILLSHGYFLHEDEREKQIMKPYVPLGMLYISAYLELHGYPNDIFDSTFSSFSQFCEKVRSFQPRVIGIYTNLMTKLNVLRMIGFLQQESPFTSIVLGGPEVRNHTEEFLAAGAHYLVMGEGEQTMLELVQWIAEGANGEPSHIDGIAWMNRGEPVRNRERVKLKDLDSLPMPSRGKVDLQCYLDTWRRYHGKNAVSVSTMRGCPYSCKWCSRAVYGQSYRRRSPKKVVEELQWIQQHYEVDSFWFVDDVFTVSHNWLAEFVTVIKEARLRISYECITRADRMNETVIHQLKESGCFRVWIGAESGSQKVIDLMDRRVEVGQVREMIRLSRSKGLEAGTFIMVGYPGETKEDIYETLHHLKTSNPDHFTITIAYPIKGTPLYEEVEDRFINAPDFSNSTDRDIDFRRTYSKAYYQRAIQMINSEMLLHRALQRPWANLFMLPRLKLRSVMAGWKMKLEEKTA